MLVVVGRQSLATAKEKERWR